jgi:hypothetical protein
MTSILFAGASLMTLSATASRVLLPENYSEPRSLVIFGFGLLAASVFARRVRSRS